MPSKPPSPCRHPSCRALVPAGGYCAAHARQTAAGYRAASQDNWERHRADDPRYELAARVRATRAWQKTVEMVRAQHPLCCDPFVVHGSMMPAMTQSVHHITPLIDRPDLAYDEANLAALCNRCHARIEGLERRGKPTAYLFRFPDYERNENAGISRAAAASTATPSQEVACVNARPCRGAITHPTPPLNTLPPRVKSLVPTVSDDAV